MPEKFGIPKCWPSYAGEIKMQKWGWMVPVSSPKIGNDTNFTVID